MDAVELVQEPFVHCPMQQLARFDDAALASPVVPDEDSEPIQLELDLLEGAKPFNAQFGD
jgi:hypothetical protein